MRLKKLFVFAAVASSLSGCAEFPEGEFCSLTWVEVRDETGAVSVPLSLERSYGYCVNNETQAEKIISAEELFKEKYVAEHPDFFSAMLDWVDKVSPKARKYIRDQFSL